MPRRQPSYLFRQKCQSAAAAAISTSPFSYGDNWICCFNSAPRLLIHVCSVEKVSAQKCVCINQCRPPWSFFFVGLWYEIRANFFCSPPNCSMRVYIWWWIAMRRSKLRRAAAGFRTGFCFWEGKGRLKKLAYLHGSHRSVKCTVWFGFFQPRARRHLLTSSWRRAFISCQKWSYSCWCFNLLAC
jgi:hypothetical protein